jgi:hypothetical protein
MGSTPILGSIVPERCLFRQCPRFIRLSGVLGGLYSRSDVSSLFFVLPSCSICVVMWSFGRLAILSANCHCLWFSRTTAGVMLASAMTVPMGVVFIHPVIALACRFSIFCTSSLLFCWPFSRHQISEPNSAVVCMVSIIIVLILWGSYRSFREVF